MTQTEELKSSQSAPAVSNRLIALDAFRGATIAFMVLVNDPGDGRTTYPPLLHADWHGWTPTDVVFPSFLWIVGVAMTLSMANRLAKGVTRAKLLAQVFRRSVFLFALGLFVYAFPHFDLSTQRILGVLQRIAICYLIAAMIYLSSGVRAQIAWIAGLLAGYWMLMTLVPVPGFGPGHLDVEGNLAHYVDRIVLGVHNYHSAKTWDPEGIVSTLPAIATALLGVMAGHILRLKRGLAERTTWLFVTGNLLLALALICNVWLPINKKLWTSSFALFMAGLDFVMLAIFVWLVDHLGYQRYVKPFYIMGMNAIAVYMASELLAETLGVTHWHTAIYERVFAPLASPMNASLLYALTYTLLMYLLAYGMYRKKWFWRV